MARLPTVITVNRKLNQANGKINQKNQMKPYLKSVPRNTTRLQRLLADKAVNCNIRIIHQMRPFSQVIF